VHYRFVTGGGKKSTKVPQLIACNTILGNLPTALEGTYDAFKFHKYAARFPGEVQYTLNLRYTLLSISPRLARACVGTRSAIARVLLTAEVSC